ncbi:HD-GYP domain-containing protein [Stutzerimonas azotifigens]|uniref:HD-GYP domain-containing protein n=1 Tax=Stutzerimonas azotifigens TaxID=291995 RepID=UPI00042116CB|nr:HD-GYP domain-containing protein [Stutzerimonas azotifigens]
MSFLKKKQKRPVSTARVQTRLRIEAAKLELGMYVVEVDRPWRETTFLFQGFPLLRARDIRVVQEHCRYVYVDETRRVAVSELHAAKPVPLVAASDRRERYEQAFSAALPEARESHEQGVLLLEQVLDDVQHGRPIDTRSCRAAIKRNLDSLLHNESALLWLTRLKSQDAYTGLHCLSVSIMAMGFANSLGLSDAEIETLGMAGLLHDVGKIRIDPAILNKPGKLTSEEFEEIKLHPVYGYEALRGQADIPAAAVHAAHGHHERLDGRGYPQGLQAGQISFFTRIITIVDAFDAITSHRAYDQARPIQVAFDVLRNNGGQQFDEKLVEQFIRWLGVFPVGTLVELHTGEVALVLEKHPELHLRPRVVVLRDAEKRPCAPRYLDLSRISVDPQGQPYRIGRGLPDGAFGLYIADCEVQAILHPEVLALLEEDELVLPASGPDEPVGEAPERPAE